jgi:hypothetical protein
MSSLNPRAFGEISSTYDPTCVPQRYSPCPAQLLDVTIGAGRPGLSPNAVVVLVFFLTVAVWIGAYCFFMWWMKKDLKKVAEMVEEEEEAGRMRLVPVIAKDGEDDGGKGKGKGKK